MPTDWWDHRKGSSLLEAILECDGDESLLPSEALQAKRKLEAARASIGPQYLTLKETINKLEKAYIMQEISLVSQSLKNYDILSNIESKNRLENRHIQLWGRLQELQESLSRPGR
jgi:hypothetical protein